MARVKTLEKPSTTVAYYRTSSAANVGVDKDSLARQRDAVMAYARGHGRRSSRDTSGSCRADQSPGRGFVDMLAYIHGNGARTILIETANRFARDLAVQLAGHDLLKKRGIELIPVDAPDHFTNDTPTAKMVRQILGSVAEFEKTSLVRSCVAPATVSRSRPAGGLKAAAVTASSIPSWCVRRGGWRASRH